ncbi:MAG: 50S ribosomal protein L9 [Holosporaceae bacterium]|jgi:large subunit ribosomal protein L9|nr:50S ribosomal protein L9 [Holosporaceae bacterium]
MEHVKVVLLQRVARLGQIGDVVNVKPGFARNYLLPKKIALRATKENLKYFEDKKTQIEAANAETRAEAAKTAEKMKAVSISLARQASDKGHLYGSVTARDIALSVKEAGFSVVPGQICLHTPIKMLGIYDVAIDLHPEVSVVIKLCVAKSEEEARQKISETFGEETAATAEVVPNPEDAREEARQKIDKTFGEETAVTAEAASNPEDVRG